MKRDDFFEWLNTCPTSWEVIQDDDETVWVSFRNVQEYNDDEDYENWKEWNNEEEDNDND